MTSQPSENITQKAILRAKRWQDRANRLLTHEEKGIQEQMRRLLSHPLDKVVLTKMIDQCFRSKNPKRVADQMNYLLTKHGTPDFLPKVDKLLVQMFLGVGRHFPEFSVSRLIDKMRHDSSRAIISGEPEPLRNHLIKRRKQGVRININHLGEEVLGEAEANHRLSTYLSDLEDPHVEVISVKISTIYSQFHPLAFDHSVTILVERLSLLYRTAAANAFIRQDETRVPKFVNLDMEAYRDLEITTTAFVKTLSQPEFKNHSAGIVLQAYLPDSYAIQRHLTNWAKRRLAAGGAPIKIRIVKGANMEIEQVESAIHNWPLAPYDNKLDVDANYKRMVRYGMEPENIRAVHLGIASHNLFELGYAYELGKANGVSNFFCFEMLEGMADHVRRALSETNEDVLLYAPVATKNAFINAIAYLIRRLDENTAAENFLRHAPSLKTNSTDWTFLKNHFADSTKRIDDAGKIPHRNQDRCHEPIEPGIGSYYQHGFRNEPDTDWSLAANRQWAQAIREKWQKRPDDDPIQIPVVIAGRDLFNDRNQRSTMDPSQYHHQVCIARYALADEDNLTVAIATAKTDPDGWRKSTPRQRHQILSQVAVNLRQARGDLIGAAVANTGKIFSEADIEVSEAVDFAEYYPHSANKYYDSRHLDIKGKGVGVVISPWNFPIAIPCGGIVAALAAGNTVIFKPSSHAVLVAWELCRCFWKAGISKNTLQMVTCDGNTLGKRLTAHPDIGFVILTGGTDTGLNIISDQPDLFLSAETGGKNATIVTAMSDRGQAIGNIIYSAFGHCGQKCSATSLLILEKELYDDRQFKNQLIDAARSLAVGSAWKFQNRMGPLIHPPGGELLEALTELLPGESWALEPKMVNDNPHIWSPGIKWNVSPGSKTHTTEFFGPLLGVMRAENLNEAITMVNQTGYGLTSGIESLDRREQLVWKKGVQAGNLYINRGTTGAVVLRQPFGGMRKSALGPGIKAGGPHYVTQFMNIAETSLPRVAPIPQKTPLMKIAQYWLQQVEWGNYPEIAVDIKKAVRAVESYLYHAAQTFYREIDYFHLRGQDNLLRFLPAGEIMVRIHPDDSLFDVLARVAAVKIARSRPLISLPPGLNNPVTQGLFSRLGQALIEGVQVVRQTDAEVAGYLPRIQRLRYAAEDRVPTIVFAKAAEIGFYIARSPVLVDGRLELIHYFINQSICHNYHRHGNLGERGVQQEGSND